ncbi:MAG: hypothetical protein AAGC55_14350, partial [Myxococcota bacterium]
MKTSAAVITGHYPTQRRLIRSLSALGCAVRQCELTRAACAEQMARPADLWLIDGDAAAEDVIWLVRALREQNTLDGAVLVSDDITAPGIFELV